MPECLVRWAADRELSAPVEVLNIWPSPNDPCVQFCIVENGLGKREWFGILDGKSCWYIATLA